MEAFTKLQNFIHIRKDTWVGLLNLEYYKICWPTLEMISEQIYEKSKSISTQF